MSYASIISNAIVNWNGDADENGTGDSNDNTANGNDGTWTGTASYGTAPYGSGKSFVLDGSSYVLRSNFADATGSRSVSVWFKSTATGNDINILELGEDSNKKIGARLHNNGQLKCLVNTTASTVSSGLNDGEWHLLVIVVEVGVGTRFYVDGTLVSTMAEAGIYSLPELFAGAGRAFNEFSGELYDVIYDDTAWSTSDIADLYAEGTTPADTVDPTLVSVEINAAGNEFTFTCNENVTADGTPTITAATALTLTYASGNGTPSIVFTSSRTVVYSESLLANIALGDFADTAGNDIAASSNVLVTNKSLSGAGGSGSVLSSGIRTGGQL